MKRLVRILIADDDDLMRTVFTSICTSLSGVQLAGVAEDGEQAVGCFQTLSPDVVLLDVNMPKLSGIEALKKIKELDPDSCVVMLTGVSSVEVVKTCVGAGARSYILKTNPPDKIRAAIKDICFERLQKIVGKLAR